MPHMRSNYPEKPVQLPINYIITHINKERKYGQENQNIWISTNEILKNFTFVSSTNSETEITSK